MGRAHKHKTRDKNKNSLPQVPKNMKIPTYGEEFSGEQASLEAQAMANAANQRIQTKRKKK
ncbi:YfhD family protein [Bacillus sp. 2205SS5-2]|uniref:YfhD family protein n=1 Tax=Bacillus sp. 2205SS5-2 TaxID=3109031 RepID=UPI0030072B38